MRLKVLALAAVAVVAMGAGKPMPASSRLDALARDYVRMSLEAGEREPGYVDAYYGPAEWQAAAKANPRTIPALRAEAARLSQAVTAVDAKALSPMERRRRAMLLGQLQAARTRLAMDDGVKFSFADEAKGLFDTRPQLKPLSAYDAELRKIDALVPGDGPLWKRVDDFQDRFIIPTDRLEPVMRAAIAECKRRTEDHIALPKDETFTLEFVKNQPWSGYNWYKGRANSLIQVNTDLPVRLSRAVDLGCHEGYPGHHVLNMLLEQKLARGRGWVEFTVYPLFSPQSLIAEGSANYGIDLAFPGDQKTAFERKVLFPLAGLDPQQADRYEAVLHAIDGLAGARFTIAQQYLDGKIDKEAAIALIQKYQLVSRKRAEQSLSFNEKYRSYVINYGLGKDMVRDYVERGGKSEAARWKRMEAVISEPTLPGDLLRR